MDVFISGKLTFLAILEQDNRPGADLLYSKLLDADIYSE
jgi:hypothetical protein